MFKAGDLVMFRDIEVPGDDLGFLMHPEIYPMFAWLREYVNWDTRRYISGKPLYCVCAGAPTLSIYSRPCCDNMRDIPYVITPDIVELMWYPPAVCTRRLTVKAADASKP